MTLQFPATLRPADQTRRLHGLVRHPAGGDTP